MCAMMEGGSRTHAIDEAAGGRLGRQFLHLNRLAPRKEAIVVDEAFPTADAMIRRLISCRVIDAAVIYCDFDCDGDAVL